MFARHSATLLVALVLAFFPSLSIAEQTRPRKIVLIAGPITGHPKDAHEYEKNIILLRHLIETSPDLKDKATVETHFNGWPADEKTLDDADTILITSDGCDHRLEDHPFYIGNRMEVLARQMKRGCGLIQFHWSTFNPVKAHDQITQWLGGYFDYETGTGTANKWRSAITTRGDWSVEPHPIHPITRGVKPFKLKEEFYHHIRFTDGDRRVTPIVTVGKSEKHEWTVGWAVQRDDLSGRGRGFGFTGGHFYENWWNDDFRLMMLNAIAWSAKIEVPTAGIRSTMPKRFRAIVLTGHNHPAHDWSTTTTALLATLELDPFAIVHVTENPEDLAGEKLKDYDLLVMNYCNWDRGGLSDKAKANFTRFVEEGGGLAVIHFANGAFNATLPAKDSDWPEFRKMVRRVWMHGDGRSGHDAFGPFKVNITSTKHAITAGLTDFETTDELYFKQEGEAAIEALATAKSKVTGKDEPMAWAYDFGKGRVFQTVLGHDAGAIRKAGALIRRGSVWAAKRENISFDPPVSITEKHLFRSGAQWKPKPRPAPGTGRGPNGAPTGTIVAKPQAANVPGVLPPTKRETVDKDANPSLQREPDWVDDRWSKTDLGRFLTCSMRTPVGDITRATAVRIDSGDNKAAVCFDADACVMRTGWTGGFLKLDPARYGLIRWPAIDGKTYFNAPKNAAWKSSAEGGAKVIYEGITIRSGRVILHYRVDDVQVRESPLFESFGEQTAIVRTFEVGARKPGARLSLPIAEGKVEVVANGPTADVAITREDGRWIMNITGQSAFTVNIVTTTGSIDHKDFQAYLAQLKLPISLDRLPVATADVKGYTLFTKGVRAADTGPYVVDTITVPFDNPGKSLFFISGVDFLRDGTLAVCTVHGEVWIVSGIDDHLERLAWRRIATGLYQPLGLKVVGNEILVLCRDRIVKLDARSLDQVAIDYDSFAAIPTATSGGHDYGACLETDAEGNLYYIDPKGIHRFSKDGKKHETIATGFRNPIAMSVGPDGEVTGSPQEGEWTPSSLIALVKRGESGKYFGYGGPRVTPQNPLGYDLPLCWVPHHVDNSTGGQTWVTSDKWGPMKGQLLNLSFGLCTAQLVLRDEVDGVAQGAVVPLKFRCSSGIMRGRFSPFDGQLYVTGMRGWQTNAVHDGCLQRIRYTGKKVLTPIGWKVGKGELSLTFAEPLDKETAEDAGGFALEQWNYLYSRTYGSKEYSVNNPGVEGHDAVTVKGAKLSADGKTVTLAVPELKPVMQVKIKYDLETKDGDAVRGEVFGTIHKVPK